MLYQCAFGQTSAYKILLWLSDTVSNTEQIWQDEQKSVPVKRWKTMERNRDMGNPEFAEGKENQVFQGIESWNQITHNLTKLQQLFKGT